MTQEESKFEVLQIGPHLQLEYSHLAGFLGIYAIYRTLEAKEIHDIFFPISLTLFTLSTICIFGGQYLFNISLIVRENELILKRKFIFFKSEKKINPGTDEFEFMYKLTKNGKYPQYIFFKSLGIVYRFIPGGHLFATYDANDNAIVGPELFYTKDKLDLFFQLLRSKIPDVKIMLVDKVPDYYYKMTKITQKDI